MTDEKATPTMRNSQPRPLMERMARAVVSNAQGEYTEEEVARVREALENRPETLARVLGEVLRGRGEG